MILANGLMNDTEILNAIAENEIAIYPYNTSNLTPVGYNLSFSRFIVSLRKKSLVKIHNKNNKWYFYLKPHETVLVLTRESIWVSKFIGGTFHSKVGLVTKGLGHVSTTLDPGWQGQLLVPLNNPTRDKIEIEIATDVDNERKYGTFITMVLFRTQSAAYSRDDNKSARIEILEKIIGAKKSNRDTFRIIKIIDKIKESTGYPDASKGLNDPENRKVKIEEFKKGHEALINSMDREFDSINRLSKATSTWYTFIYWCLLGLSVLMMFAIAYVGFVYEDGKYKDYCTILISILVPFIIFGFGNIKDRFI